MLGAQSHPFPGIFLEHAHASVEDRRVHDLDAAEPDLVHARQIGEHHVVGHGCSPERLLGIRERRVRELHVLHHRGSLVRLEVEVAYPTLMHNLTSTRATTTRNGATQ